MCIHMLFSLSLSAHRFEADEVFFLTLRHLPENEGALIVFPNISMVTIMDDDCKAGREGGHTHIETLRTLCMPYSADTTHEQVVM